MVPPMRLARAEWILRRLAAMSPAEIAHRAVEQARRQAWRNDRRGWAAFSCTDGPLAAPAVLAERLRAPVGPAVAEQVAAATTALREGRLTLMGQTWPAEPGPARPNFWLMDPLSRQSWPGEARYCFDVGYRHGTTTGLGDVKYVWEPNRWQFLQPLALLAAQGDGEARQTILAALDAWIEANPPFRGINWPSGIELAFRLVSLVVIVAGLDGGSIAPAIRIRLRQLVAAHAFWLARYPSLHSSANNHRLAEGLGLAAAAVLTPDHRDASTWTSEADSIVAELTPALFSRDGVYLEQSPTYGASALEMLGFFAMLRGGILPGGAAATVVAGLEHARVMLDSSCQAPRIGDDDEGRIIWAAPGHERRFVASALAATAAAIGRPDLAPADHDVSLRDVVFGTQPHGRVAADGVHVFRDGGYTAVRQPVAGHAMLLVFDHGPLGYLSIAAHGHADALAVWLHLDDQPVLVDAGTFLYHSGGGVRDLFRSTALHNTLRVCGAEQSLPAGAFNWRHKARAWLTACDTGPGWSIAAQHDGYVKRFGVRHARRLVAEPDGFRIEDRLEGGSSALEIDAGFLVHPALDVSVDGHTAIVTRAGHTLARLALSGAAGLQVGTARGEASPRPGCYSPAFSVREDATMIVATGRLGPGEVLSTRVTILPV